MISFDEAYKLTIESISPLGVETVELIQSVNRVLGEDLHANVWSPTLDVSLKDGYAVCSEDVKDAGPDNHVTLNLVGRIAAGGDWTGEIGPGQTVRILSGAPVPKGAQAVLAEEFAVEKDDKVTVFNNAAPGRNVLNRGNDVKKGQKLANSGDVLNPPMVGYLASAGYDRVPVVKNPRVAIVATGDEVIAPGQTLEDGKLYASNLVTLAAWCHKYGFAVDTQVIQDSEKHIHEALKTALENYDAVLTSGGAWKGEKDLVVRILEKLNWEKKYHYVRIGPGKAIGFGMVDCKPVFCLPGGPPSNHMAFLQLALPGLQKMAGKSNTGLPTVDVQLAETVKGQSNWTQFIHGVLKEQAKSILFYPLHQKSRLQMIAHTEAVLKIPEGQDLIPEGKIVQVQKLK